VQTRDARARVIQRKSVHLRLNVKANRDGHEWLFIDNFINVIIDGMVIVRQLLRIFNVTRIAQSKLSRRRYCKQLDRV